MKKVIILFSIFVVCSFLFFNCGGSQTATNLSEVSIPEWYLTPPSDANYLYAPATAVSKDLELSVTKASTDARAEIGRQIEVKLNTLQKRFSEEVGVGSNSQLLEQFTTATKTVVSMELNGSKIIKKEVGKESAKEGSTYRAYVLAEYPIGAASQAFLEQLKQQEQLYTRFRATEAFKDLDDEVKKYEDWKKNQ